MNEKVEQYSPDKKHKLTFYGFKEPRMAMSICRFSLTDLETNQIIDFNPLWAIGIGQSGFSWSEDQTLFSIHLFDPPNGIIINDNFFIYNIKKSCFSSIHFSTWNLIGRCHNDHIEIEYDEHIAGENLKYPTKDLSKPGNLRFDFSGLQWIDIKSLPQFNELSENATVNKFKPIDHGWRPFKGELPKTTEMLIWELREFAKYGDVQSQRWFAEIEAKTDKINYWVNASHYLGLKNRESST